MSWHSAALVSRDGPPVHRTPARRALAAARPQCESQLDGYDHRDGESARARGVHSRYACGVVCPAQPTVSPPERMRCVSRNWLPFGALEAATIFSGTANGISMIAFPWLVLEATGSASAAGRWVPSPRLRCWSLFFRRGDRRHRRSPPGGVVSDLLSMTSVALVPIPVVGTPLSFWLLAALAVLGATFDPAGISAREAMLPEACSQRGTAPGTGQWDPRGDLGCRFPIGPGIGGLAIGFLGAATTFWLSAAMFAVGAPDHVCRPDTRGRTPAASRGRLRWWTSTVEGVWFVWNDRILRTVGLVSMVIVGFWLPIEGVVLPSISRAWNNRSGSASP